MIFEISDIKDPRVKIFASLTETQLRRCLDISGAIDPCDDVIGLFIAESPKVIQVAIQHDYIPEAILCERRHITGDAASILKQFPELPIYTAEREILRELTGYTLTRGVLCAMRRRPLLSLSSLCEDSKIICVLQSVTDTTNIGAIFRSASALGVDGVVLSADTCDPLNRRAVRVSMGSVFTVPWTVTEHPVEELRSLGFKTVALALCDDSISLQDIRLKKESRLAVVFGTEGDGLPRTIINGCDYTVKIPMSHGVDSLNVAAAAAVTFWELTKTNHSK